MIRLHHIGDLHVRSDIDNNRVVSEKLKEIRADWDSRVRGHFVPSALSWERNENKDNDWLIITGDITDDGKERQYSRAWDLLYPFCGRMIMVPGNHDYGAIGNFYSKKCAERFHSFRAGMKAVRESVDDTSTQGFGVEFLLLDTCLHTGSVVDLAQGKVGFWRRLWLKRELARIRKKGWKSVVVMHHSPLESKWWLRLQDAQQFLGVVLGHADYVLCGHTHHGFGKQHYPSGLPEELAQTWIYDAGALFQGKGPHVIEVTR